SQDSEKVLFGASVLVLDEDGVEKKLRIVGQDEIELSQGWISWQSPVAKALLGARRGDVVSAQTPRGTQDFEVLEISYEED
ncbi:transcription elongation factor GreB, partial [bacterium]|nr:transcription elongation factor GreB [bacterium]